VKLSFLKRFPKTLVAYCDESSTNSRFLVIGGIFFGFEDSADVEANVRLIENHIAEVKKRHGITHSMKWAKTPSKAGRFLNGYAAVLRDFLETEFAHFKCMVVDTQAYPVDNRQRWGGDWLVGFQKYYCVFLADGLLSRYPNYFFDVRIDDYAFRAGCDAALLQETVQRRHVKRRRPKPCLEYCIVKALNDRQHNLLQLADLLVGAVAFVWNGGMQQTSAKAVHRQELVGLIQDIRKVDLSVPLRWTRSWFNIWQLQPNP
jgi:hypothetical protein